VDRRLGDLRSSINVEQDFETDDVNAKIEAVATLAASVGNTEIVEGAANEIRDSMQAAMEDLSELVNISTTTNEHGKLSLFIAGYEMITDNAMTGSVKIHTDSNGMNFMADNKTGDVLTLQSGSVKGLIDVRDGSIKDLQDQLNSLASELITEVNAKHQTGFDLSANNDTSLTFFTGTNASDIGVNSAIISDPRLLQAAGTGEVGDNTAIREMAEVGATAISGLNNMTFSEHYGNTISRFGQEMALTDTKLIDQLAVQGMLEKQRDSVQGVSIDEEVANLIIYQRAFQASARLISTMDTLMNDVMNMQR